MPNVELVDVRRASALPPDFRPYLSAYDNELGQDGWVVFVGAEAQLPSSCDLAAFASWPRCAGVLERGCANLTDAANGLHELARCIWGVQGDTALRAVREGLERVIKAKEQVGEVEEGGAALYRIAMSGIGLASGKSLLRYRSRGCGADQVEQSRVE